MKTSILGPVFLMALGCIISSETAGKEARAPTKSEVAGVWVGLSEDDLYYYRCDLRPEGNGTLTAVFLKEKADALDITEWTYGNRKITLALSGNAAKISGIKSVTGEVSANRLLLRITGNQLAESCDVAA